MKTDDLVAVLVADRAASGRSFARGLVLALLTGGLLSLGLFFAVLGLREDLAAALATWRFDLKLGLVLLAAQRGGQAPGKARKQAQAPAAPGRA